VELAAEAMVVLLQDTLDVELFQMENVELLIQVVGLVELLLPVIMMVDKVAQEFYLQKN
jgi:hypothetical protein